mmetsp:Transcript_14695/g.31363  ORF Transcript_14695/g.31363 Transcript_14695/m.31363 type:complete len:104 (+) Transcript_14695:267-578(+)
MKWLFASPILMSALTSGFTTSPRSLSGSTVVQQQQQQQQQRAQIRVTEAHARDSVVGSLFSSNSDDADTDAESASASALATATMAGRNIKQFRTARKPRAKRL